MPHNLADWGWDVSFQARFAPFAAEGLIPGRVVAAHRHLYEVVTTTGECLAAVSGRHRHEALGPQDFPAVGDWVALSLETGSDRAVVHHVLPRRSRFSRSAVGGGGAAEQVVASNVDTVLLVTALNRDYNPRRIERYVAAGWESGAQPVVILSKADLCPEAPERVAEVEGLAPGVPVHAVSSVLGSGLDALAPYLAPGRTVALLGSSGAGKSTLLNALAGREVMATGHVRESDDRGRHTTTRRELVRLEAGGLLIDTPGMRELGLWDATEGVSQAFGDVEALSADCRFNDCRHDSEVGCAVRDALDAGHLSANRLASYTKLQRELAFQKRRTDVRARLEEQARWKALHKAMRHNPKR
ncbi:MAG: ribosome small subunit-dependent GTPase A [Candidatus Sericytochromatia bacterium]